MIRAGFVDTGSVNLGGTARDGLPPASDYVYTNTFNDIAHKMQTCERLGLGQDKFMLTFQSRFGTAEWLQPYTDMTVKALAERGVKNLAIVTPGFAADCLETLEEIAGENAEIFHHAGGKNFAAIPCLNDSEAGMAVISHVVLRELKGWV